MKRGKRIFLIMGALSIFALFQFDVMADTYNPCNSVNAGKYCLKKNNKETCPAGCYCIKKNNVEAVANITGLPDDRAVRYACATKDQSKESALNSRGVYYCAPGKTSHSGSKLSSDCKDGETAYDGSDNCSGDLTAGRYCSSSSSDAKCPAGCYCDGSRNENAVGSKWWNSANQAWETIAVKSWCNGHYRTYLKNYLEKRGIHYCPADKPYSNEGAKSESDCNAGVAEAGKPCGDNNPAAPGFFCKAGLTYKCRKGCYCLGGKNTNTGWAIDDLCRTHDETKINGINDKNDTGIRVCMPGFDETVGAKSLSECKNSQGENPVNQNKPRRPGSNPQPDEPPADPDDPNQIHCPDGGQYWDSGAGQCKLCPKGYYCPADRDDKIACTNNTVATTEGSTNCTSCRPGYQANSNHDACTPRTYSGDIADVGQIQDRYQGLVNPQNPTPPAEIHCDAGKYWNGTECATCASQGNYFVCPGDNGLYLALNYCQNGIVNAAQNGCDSCDDGKEPNELHTLCVTSGGGDDPVDPIPVTCRIAGKYYDAEDDDCYDCGDDYFCPGDGYAYECPFDGKSTGNLGGKRCKVSLDKDDLKNGTLGSCWTKTSAAEYKRCVFGNLDGYWQ